MTKETTGDGNGLRNLTLSVLLVVMIGHLLVIGQGLLLPILIALISVYIMAALDQQLATLPLTRRLPTFVRRLVLVLVFIGLLVAFTSLVIVTVQQLMTQAPSYQENLERLFADATHLLGFEKVPDWGTIRSALLGQINLQAWLSSAAGQLSSAGGMFFLIVIYITFLFSEKAAFGAKLEAAFPNTGQAEQTQNLIGAINERVGQYLGTKTLINVILGAVSYLILAMFGVDYAAFWALLIGLLNYIPYIGSIIALILPVALSIVQFASWPITIGLYAALQVAQIAVGNFLEPKMVGRRVNLSPFVVLVSLALWSAMWGIAGAILAVPLTSILVIIFSEIPATRPLAILMSEDVGLFRRTFRNTTRRSSAGRDDAGAQAPN